MSMLVQGLKVSTVQGPGGLFYRRTLHLCDPIKHRQLPPPAKTIRPPCTPQPITTPTTRGNHYHNGSPQDYRRHHGPCEEGENRGVGRNGAPDCGMGTEYPCALAMQRRAGHIQNHGVQAYLESNHAASMPNQGLSLRVTSAMQTWLFGLSVAELSATSAVLPDLYHYSEDEEVAEKRAVMATTFLHNNNPSPTGYGHFFRMQLQVEMAWASELKTIENVAVLWVTTEGQAAAGQTRLHETFGPRGFVDYDNDPRGRSPNDRRRQRVTWMRALNGRRVRNIVATWGLKEKLAAERAEDTGKGKQSAQDDNAEDLPPAPQTIEELELFSASLQTRLKDREEELEGLFEYTAIKPTQRSEAFTDDLTAILDALFLYGKASEIRRLSLFSFWVYWKGLRKSLEDEWRLEHTRICQAIGPQEHCIIICTAYQRMLFTTVLINPGLLGSATIEYFSAP
ncbi:uncharacterized protein EV422DRAFT_526817 [Fimicolochytrium jonesii]|uniref:uncharacterized protein n=1 Tax=Fimicolochytrium jonesii TaxID=1396493 RepID=UPI0022FE32A7|nr:uncharacterized protein EV422DRAFT_526817 [Fimicolochytrium jonesii]KAI8821756.1 hypothetical protein EV422DRAFT_526817 [Fimicolochytrium jonesii]